MNYNLFKTFLPALVLAAAPAAWAAPVYNFGSHPGPLTNSQSYVSNGVTITAYGFNSLGQGINLFGKNGTGDEFGLGINNTPSDEIGTTNFVQLDLTNFLATNPMSILMSIGSVQGSEGWNIYVSNSLGTLGTLLQTGTIDAPATFALKAFPKSDNFVSVQASSGNVLLSTLASTGSSVPEPGSAMMLGAGLLALGSLANRARRG